MIDTAAGYFDKPLETPLSLNVGQATNPLSAQCGAE